MQTRADVVGFVGAAQHMYQLLSVKLCENPTLDSLHDQF